MKSANCRAGALAPRLGAKFLIVTHRSVSTIKIARGRKPARTAASHFAQTA
jgi:hypothetical protein